MDKIKIINPFTDIPIIPIDPVTVDEEAKSGNTINNVTEFTVGEGDEVIHISTQGIWAGAEDFASAPWSVDLDGNMTGGGGGVTLPIKYGKTAFSDIVNAGFWIGDSGVFIGNLNNTKHIKYDVSGDTMVLTNVLLQTSASANTGVKISNDLSGIVVYGETLHFNDGSGGGDEGHISIDVSHNLKIDADNYVNLSADVLVDGDIIPSSTNTYYIGDSTHVMKGIYSYSYSIASGGALTGSSGDMVCSTRFKCTSLFVNGTQYNPTSGAYDASKYYLRSA